MNRWRRFGRPVLVGALAIDLYRAVLEGGVRTVDDWIEWERTHETGVLTGWKP